MESGSHQLNRVQFPSMAWAACYHVEPLEATQEASREGGACPSARPPGPSPTLGWHQDANGTCQSLALAPQVVETALWFCFRYLRTSILAVLVPTAFSQSTLPALVPFRSELPRPRLRPHLRMDPRAPRMLHRCSTTDLYPRLRSVIFTPTPLLLSSN